MQASCRLGLVAGLLLLGCGQALLASEADDLRDKAAAVRKEAAAAAEKGNKEDAEKLEQIAAKLLHAAEQAQAKGQESGKGEFERAAWLKEQLNELRAMAQKAAMAKAPE